MEKRILLSWKYFPVKCKFMHNIFSMWLVLTTNSTQKMNRDCQESYFELLDELMYEIAWELDIHDGLQQTQGSHWLVKFDRQPEKRGKK